MLATTYALKYKFGSVTTMFTVHAKLVNIEIET